jgi:hypothetical protein
MVGRLDTEQNENFVNFRPYVACTEERSCTNTSYGTYMFRNRHIALMSYDIRSCSITGMCSVSSLPTILPFVNLTLCHMYLCMYIHKAFTPVLKSIDMCISNNYHRQHARQFKYVYVHIMYV